MYIGRFYGPWRDNPRDGFNQHYKMDDVKGWH